MQNRMVVLLCNLKPAKTRGVLSQAVVMCASSPAKVEILDPPGGAAPGDRVTVQGFPGTLTDSSATWSLHFTTTSNHQEYHKDITEWPVKHIAVFRKWLILLPRNKKSWFHTAQCASNIFFGRITPLGGFWNTDCEPGFTAKPQWSLVAEWERNPCSQFP